MERQHALPSAYILSVSALRSVGDAAVVTARSCHCNCVCYIIINYTTDMRCTAMMTLQNKGNNVL